MDTDELGRLVVRNGLPVGRSRQTDAVGLKGSALRAVVRVARQLAPYVALGVSSIAAASGQNPSVTISGVTPAQVSSEIVARCIRNGHSVPRNSPEQVICSKPFPDTIAAYAFRALAAPKNSTNPVMFARYNLAQTSEGTIVGADFYYEFVTALGQQNTQPIVQKKVLAEAQQGLDQMKAEFENSDASKLTTERQDVKATMTPPEDYWMVARNMAESKGCKSGFVQTEKQEGREVFRAECASGDPVLIECWMGICRPL